MNAPDLDDFATLWRERDPEEERVFRALARRVGWRARAMRFAEYALAAVVIAAIVAGIIWNQHPVTLALGLLLGAAVVWEAWRRRLLYDTALISDLGSREEMIAAALKRSRREFRQARAGLLQFPLGVFLMTILNFSVATGGEIERFATAFLAGVRRGDSALAVLVCIALALLYFLLRSLRLRREVTRLEALQSDYRAESLRDDDEREG